MLEKGLWFGCGVDVSPFCSRVKRASAPEGEVEHNGCQVVECWVSSRKCVERSVDKKLAVSDVVIDKYVSDTRD